VRRQVDRCVREIQATLGDSLVGIYLHGSLALGSFNPDGSDVDLLVVSQHPLSVESKRRAIEQLLECSEHPQPIEISFLRRADLQPWRYPTPFDLHYSETWRARYARELASDAWRCWNDTQRYDPDLAAHFTILRHRGICLVGAPIADIFPEVPRHDYLASAMEDVLSALDDIAANPVYAILNACRTYAYLRDGRICSKDEGGAWALRALPLEGHRLIEEALGMYRGEQARIAIDNARLESFATYMRTTLTNLTQQ
jgi:streptomycin 3"-adenylyltransferase